MNPATSDDTNRTMEERKLQIEERKLDIELRKIDIAFQQLRVERSKRTWTAISGIVIPLLIGVASGFYTYSTLVLKPRADFIDLISKNPAQRDQIINDWSDMFPGDRWLQEFKDRKKH
jgi:hypothetical protein